MSDHGRGSRVVVTGGSGFIGGHLVEHLLRRGADVTVFDKEIPPGASQDVRHVVGDLRDEAALGRAIGRGVDTVYHLAAVVGVDTYLARPADVIDTNYTGSRNVLTLAHRVGARVVLASTSEVFGRNREVPWNEDADRVLGSSAAHRWSYGTSKGLAEHLTFAFVQQHGLEASIIRYFNVFGPRQRPAYVISRSVHRALNGLPLVVYDGGRQTRCFTYVDDAVEATVRAGATDAALGLAFNIGSQRELSVRDAVENVASLVGGASVVEVDMAERFGRSYEDLDRRVPDCSRAADVLDWRAETPFEDGLRRTVDWARAASWWLRLPDSGAS